MGRMITKDEKEYFMNLKPNDICKTLIIDLFVKRCKVENKKFTQKPPKFNTNDLMVLEAKEYFNKEKITTNLGLFIYNKFLFEEDLQDVVGYVNDTVNKKVHAKVESKISSALIDGKISAEQMVRYLDKLQWLGYQFSAVFNPSYSIKGIRNNSNVMKEKKRLFKENEKGVNDGDPIVGSKIEEELIKIAKDELKGDHGLDMYNSGARGSFENNYKNMFIMRGPLKDYSDNKYKIVERSLTEGISKNDMPEFASSAVDGTYPKSIGTAVSGAMSKELIAAYQAISLDKKGSDCGTKMTLDIVLTPSIKKYFVYSYIMDGTKLTLLTNDNIDKYINKKIKVRNPMFCIGDKICNTCAGDLYYRLGITNIGMMAANLSGKLLNGGMKKFHSNNINAKQIDLNDIVL